MDFHSLTRRELQSLCKLNKIPANITNVAMADALQSLKIVEGIDEFVKDSQFETVDLGESVEKVEVLSPKALQTRCRTSTRQRVKTTETEALPPTVTRTTRRGSKQLPSEVEESLKTPAVSRTCRKATATTSRRNVNSQLNECENEAKEEGLVYSTRRSTQLTEKKKSAVTKVKKGIEKAVKIDSFLDQENVMETGDSNVMVEDICNAFEKLDVVVIEEEATHKGGEVKSPKQQSDENTTSSEDTLKVSEVKMDDVKSDKNDEDSKESHETSNAYEDEKISGMKIDQVCDVKPESDGPSEEQSDEEDEKCEEEKISEMKIDEGCDVKPESDGISSPSEEADTHKSVEEDENCDEVWKTSEVIIDEVKPCEDAQKPDLEDDNHADSDVSSTMEISIDEIATEDNGAISGLTHVTPIMNSVVSDDKENSVVDEGKNIMEKKDVMKKLNEISMRQLKKQLKALTLKNLNKKEEAVAATTTRPALQVVCENQMVVGGGETEN